MERSTLDEGLLLKPQQGDINQNQERVSCALIAQEMKKIGYLAGPMVAVTVAQLMLQVVSIMMVGHLGELALSSTALAISIAGVTGFSFLQGMACALETLCGQAFGAKQFKKIGTQTYTAIFSLFLICIPISILWINIKKILIFFGQDPLIAHEAGIFITWLLPALFAYAPLHPLVRYFQSQSMIFPLVISSCFTIIFHVFITWFLVFKTSLSNRGAAIGLALSLWSNATILFLYMRFSPTCEKTRSPVTMDIFRGIKEFFYFAIPSALMICLEWWSYELIILLS
ncbi:hypothetical protein Leryth_006257 [Lithospermum erythrorhizon]|nr:hypothetical protein Leryth_006257 [Lithospermum erythrorhizon]